MLTFWQNLPWAPASAIALIVMCLVGVLIVVLTRRRRHWYMTSSHPSFFQSRDYKDLR
jgi:hypothetical protein